ncbi:MAG: hypothetical protein JWM95_2543 [Gemmatimonadetes bacterium]|nr:hypothetical protein [Gemmatimonadota bacterium]
MSLRLRNLRPAHLLAAWTAYWIALVGVTVGPAIVKIWQVTRDTRPQSSVSAGFGDGNLNLQVLKGTATVWAGSASMSTVALFIAVPPLLLWIAWLAARPRGTHTPEPRLLSEQRDVRPAPHRHPDAVPNEPPSERRS